MITRRAFLRTAFAALGSCAAFGSYAFAIEPGFRLRVQRWELRPAAWRRGHRLRIAVIADLHAGAPHMGQSRVDAIVETANALEPDLALLLGDYAASHRFVTGPVPIASVAKSCAALSARLGVYAVLGNHDWWDDHDAQRRGAGPTLSHAALASQGIRVLENNSLVIDDAPGPFQLAGLGDQLAFSYILRRKLGGPPRHFAPALIPSAGIDDLPATLATLDKALPTILMAHEPDIFPAVPPHVALTVSGHTHGGQVNLFGWRPIVPSRYGPRYSYGVIEEMARSLVVSGGLGCSVAPVRFGVPPEITLIDLS